MGRGRVRGRWGGVGIGQAQSGEGDVGVRREKLSKVST